MHARCAGGLGSGGANSGAMAPDLGAAETRQSPPGAAQPLLPEPPEGAAWSMQDLAARCVCTLSLTAWATFHYVEVLPCRYEKELQHQGWEGVPLQ